MVWIEVAASQGENLVKWFARSDADLEIVMPSCYCEGLDERIGQRVKGVWERVRRAYRQEPELGGGGDSDPPGTPYEGAFRATASTTIPSAISTAQLADLHKDSGKLCEGGPSSSAPSSTSAPTPQPATRPQVVVVSPAVTTTVAPCHVSSKLEAAFHKVHRSEAPVASAEVAEAAEMDPARVSTQT